MSEVSIKYFQVWINKQSDPFSKIVSYSIEKEYKYYGKSYTFTHVENSNTKFIQRVTKCFHKDFLSRHQALHLLKFICIMDEAWMNVISPEKHGFTCNSPCTMSGNTNYCEFYFERSLK